MHERDFYLYSWRSIGAGITITAFAFALDVLNSKHKKGDK